MWLLTCPFQGQIDVSTSQLCLLLCDSMRVYSCVHLRQSAFGIHGLLSELLVLHFPMFTVLHEFK